MPDLFKNKYRIGSTRLQTWNYGWNAAYFVTICTRDGENYFGRIENDLMHLSNAGIVADICWHDIKNHAQNIDLGEFVVMPNHVHGIVILRGNKLKNDPAKTTEPHTIETGRAVETRHALSLRSAVQPIPPTPGQSRFQNQGKNTLSSIVGSYKSAVTRHANRLGFEFSWLSRFHDHIIRDENSFERISKYIRENPLKWKDDKFYRE